MSGQRSCSVNAPALSWCVATQCCACNKAQGVTAIVHVADACRFLTTPDPDDPVVKSHYRMIRSFTADDPRPLVPGEIG